MFLALVCIHPSLLNATRLLVLACVLTVTKEICVTLPYVCVSVELLVIFMLLFCLDSVMMAGGVSIVLNSAPVLLFARAVILLMARARVCLDI